jgi:hypothetical protein
MEILLPDQGTEYARILAGTLAGFAIWHCYPLNCASFGKLTSACESRSLFMTPMFPQRLHGDCYCDAHTCHRAELGPAVWLYNMLPKSVNGLNNVSTAASRQQYWASTHKTCVMASPSAVAGTTFPTSRRTFILC